RRRPSTQVGRVSVRRAACLQGRRQAGCGQALGKPTWIGERQGTQGVNYTWPLKSSGGHAVHARVAQLAEQGTLNPKVQGSIPCASTNMLCPRASGRAPGVPDVSTGGGQHLPRRLLTAYLTAYRSGTKPQNCRQKGFA